MKLYFGGVGKCRVTNQFRDKKMNTKIREFAEQAGYQEGFRFALEGFDMEKFAELIIKETLEVVRDEVQYALDDYLADTIDLRVKNHFGIE